MKRIIGTLAVTGLATLASGAYAASINTCPGGAPNTVTASPDNTAYSAFFDNFIVLPGDVGTCAYSFPLNATPSGVVSIFSADYRGEVDLDPGETADLTIEHNGTSDGETFTDPGPGPALLHQDVVASDGGEIKTTATMDLSGDDPSGFSLGTIDTVDYTEVGRISLPGDETSIVANLGATGDLLLGANQKTEGDNEAGVIGGVGSAMFGVNGRYNLSDGFSLLGGVSLVNETTNFGTPYSGIVGAGAVRYIDANSTNSFRLFGEGGAIASGLQATFTPATGATPVTSTLGFGTFYGRGGVIINPDPANEVTLSATLAESVFGNDAFALSSGPFAATIGAQQGYFTTVKGTAQWTTQLAPAVDLTATGSVGAVLATSTVGIHATVTGYGALDLASAPPGTLFAEYGARLGWKPVDNVRLDGFVWGVTGTNIGSHNMVGAQAHWEF